jgi:hypothetical protein
MTDRPALKPLHSDLIPLKVQTFEKIDTEELVKSLAPGQEHCLKTRDDGTMLDGHHRIHVLRCRGVEVDMLPREIVAKDESIG